MNRRLVFLCALCLLLSSIPSPLQAQEWVTFEGTTAVGGKLQLTGILNVPEGDSPFPAVVMLHVCAGLKDEGAAKRQDAWAQRLKSWGYVTLQVDSFGPRGYGNICASTATVSKTDRSYDAFSAKSYLSKLKYVDSKNIAAWCESFTSFDTPLLILIGEKDERCPLSECIATKKMLN